MDKGFKRKIGFVFALLLVLVMAGISFSGYAARVTTWGSGQTLTASSLNAEFDNVLDNGVGVTTTQTLTNKTLTTPTIDSFTNATHNHSSAAEGGSPLTGTFTGFVNSSTAIEADGGIKTDGITTLKTKVVDIGDWNMVSTATVSVSLGGVTRANIRSLNVTIRDDAGSLFHPLASVATDGTTIQGGIAAVTTGNLIAMYRLTGGSFDGTSYDSTSYNRGWATIQYVP